MPSSLPSTAASKPSIRSYGNLDRYRLLEQGDAALSFYKATNLQRPHQRATVRTE